MEDTSGFYRLTDYGLEYAPNYVYHKDYTLEREGNRNPIDGWEWYNKEPLAHEITQEGKVPYSITQLQAKLQLHALGLYDQVESIVNQAGPPTKIYWLTAANWERNSPIINSLASAIFPENTQETLDQFFIDASKLN
jgi:hypothetical protein